MKIHIPKYFFNKYWIPTYNSDDKRAKLIKRFNKGNYKTPQAILSFKNSLYKIKLKKEPTKAEIIFGDWLWYNKIYFQFQKGFFKPYHRIVDFYFPEKRIIIEIDGGYHLDTKEKDINKDDNWSLRGYLCMRFTNEEIFDNSFINTMKCLLK